MTWDPTGRNSGAKGFRTVNGFNPHSKDEIMHRDSGYNDWYDGYGEKTQKLRPIIKFNINELRISLSEDGTYNINPMN